MKKQNLVLIPLLTLLFTLSAFANWETVSLSEVAVMHGRDDGKYDVFCTDGSREIVTDLDIRLNNVCPNLKSNTPTNILSLQKRDDGDFDVVCRDLRKLVASEEQIIAGGVCGDIPPRLALEDGTYKVISGYGGYYKQVAKAQMEGAILKSVFLYVAETNWRCELKCEGNACRGVTDNSTCRVSSLEVLGPKQYRFKTNSPEAIFEKM